MTHHTAPSRPFRRRLAGTGALLAIVTIGLAGGARPAAAADEFPAHPAVTVVSTCTPESAIATVTVSNAGGLSFADFVVSIVGSDLERNFSIAPNTTDSATFGFAEGETATIHTNASGDFSQDDVVGPFNCTDYQGEIVLTCDGTQPVLTGTYENMGVLDSALSLSTDDDEVLQPTGEKQEPLTLKVPDHQPFNATLSTDLEGDFATLAGTPDCDQAVATTSTTSTTSTVPVSVISVNTPNPPVANVTLARTGTNTWPLVGAGIALIGLGLAFRRRAARLA